MQTAGCCARRAYCPATAKSGGVSTARLAEARRRSGPRPYQPRTATAPRTRVCAYIDRRDGLRAHPGDAARHMPSSAPRSVDLRRGHCATVQAGRPRQGSGIHARPRTRPSLCMFRCSRCSPARRCRRPLTRRSATRLHARGPRPRRDHHRGRRDRSPRPACALARRPSRVREHALDGLRRRRARREPQRVRARARARTPGAAKNPRGTPPRCPRGHDPDAALDAEHLQRRDGSTSAAAMVMDPAAARIEMVASSSVNGRAGEGGGGGRDAARSRGPAASSQPCSGRSWR